MYYFTPANFLALSTLIMSTLLAVSSTNWLMAWVAMEINLLSFIPLIISMKTNQETEASVKYFLSQALGSALMLMASIMLWCLSFPSELALSILSLSLLIKLGAAPCHFWFPSVMTSMSWMNCLILATWQKLGPLVLLCFPLQNSINLQYLAGPVAALNAMVGGVMGLNQSHLRTLLAYSSITHMGWMISAMCMNMPMLGMIYFITYALIISPLFMLFGLTSTSTSSQFPLSLHYKFMLPATSMLLMSLAGLPPLTGFLPKWLMISWLMHSNNLVVSFLLLGSFLNLYFYLNVVFNILSTTSNSAQFSPTPVMTNYLPILVLPASSLLGMVLLIMYALTLLNKP